LWKCRKTAPSTSGSTALSPSPLLSHFVSSIVIEQDKQLTNGETFHIQREEHTLGNLLKTKLLQDPRVVFAGYKNPHPLEPSIDIRVQTLSDDYGPTDALTAACDAVIADFDELLRLVTHP
jgi:DNA-directed RNA polymerase II subunit RPB11